METKREHLIVDAVEMVDTTTWDGLGAFSVAGNLHELAMNGGREAGLNRSHVQALVRGRYGPSIKGRPTDGMTLHMLMHPTLAPRAGSILRVTIEEQPEGGWPDWNGSERELVEKGVDLGLPGGRRTSDAL